MTNKAPIIRIAAKTDVGKVREHNEDNYVVCPDLQKGEWYLINGDVNLSAQGALFVIADGMGGMNAGEIASAIAVETVKKYFSESINNEAGISDAEVKSHLFESIKAAQQEILNYAGTHPEAKGMGTTIVISWIKDNILHTAWVGDSRCYVWRSDKNLYFATKDHSYVQDLVDSNKITLEQAFYHPENNIITRSLGDGSGKNWEPDYCCFQLENGDRVLMCSDGLNGMLQDKDITKILDSNSDLQQCTSELIIAANNEGGHDNITVILYDITSLGNVTRNYGLNLNKLTLASAPQADESDDFSHDTLSPQDEVKDHSQKKEKKSVWNSKLYYLLIIPFLFLGYLLYFSFQEKNITTQINADSNTDSLKKMDTPKPDSEIYSENSDSLIQLTISNRRSRGSDPNDKADNSKKDKDMNKIIIPPSDSLTEIKITAIDNDSNSRNQ